MEPKNEKRFEILLIEDNQNDVELFLNVVDWINMGDQVRVFLDAGLMSHAIVNCHPLINTATTSIASSDLVKFLKATGHDPVILKLTAESPN